MTFIFVPKGRSTFSTEPNQEVALLSKGAEYKTPLSSPEDIGNLPSSNSERALHTAKVAMYHRSHVVGDQLPAETQGRKAVPGAEHMKVLYFQGHFCSITAKNFGHFCK